MFERIHKNLKGDKSVFTVCLLRRADQCITMTTTAAPKANTTAGSRDKSLTGL